MVPHYQSDAHNAPECQYDIVVFCGAWGEPWDLSSRSLGGSEKAIMYLAKFWAASGLQVAVYADVVVHNPNREDGVHYFHTFDFNPLQRFNNLVLWRNFGMYPISNLQCPLMVNKLFIDLHDNLDASYMAVKKIIDSRAYPYLKVMFKSEFHKSEYERCTRTPIKLYHVIPNGVEIDIFKQPQPKRHPLRFCYTSQHDRGLSKILSDIWPKLQEQEPNSRLHVYCDIPKNMKADESVIYHGRRPIEEISLEKNIAQFHIYLTDTNVEVDCIAIKESLVAGCIPLLLNVNVFKERDGIRFNPEMSNDEIVEQIVRFMKNNEWCDQLSDTLRRSVTIKSWDEVAASWLELMG
jgi:glycosyltransferase involved in cell wall biosynthesis